MIAALSSSVTVLGTLLAGLGGIALALLSPLLVTRLGLGGAPTPPLTRFVVLFGLQVLAAMLLFAAGKAFGLLPTLATPVKVGVIMLMALVLTSLGAVVSRLGRGDA